MPRAEILARFKKLGILSTPQRLEVARILLSKPQHLSADEIIARLRRRHRKVSQATVYNCLKLFGEKGLVKERIVDAERRFYDSTTTPHHHFYNVDTGELSDIPADSVELSGLPPLPDGTVLEGAELVLRIRNTRD
jgi:Fur family iron response transcriptional regulator